MKRFSIICCAPLIFAISAIPARSQEAALGEVIPQQTLEQLPVREIAVFKDGHVFVAHEGELPTDARGNVRIDYLPRPVVGSFWASSRDERADLRSVQANRRRVTVKRTALSIRELVEANLGKHVMITETGGESYQGDRYSAQLLEIPTRSSREIHETSPPNSDEALPQKGNIVLVRTDMGTRAVPFELIRDITIKEGPSGQFTEETFRDIMTLHLDWRGESPPASAEVGITYLQKGIRWIPNYRVTIDGEGNAHVELQATLINELTDLHDVSASLIIGVPSIPFADTVDPISLQQTVARLSSHFDRGDMLSFSNTLFTQQARGPSSARYSAEAGSSDTIDLGPEIAGAEQSEDLFVFHLEHVTLEKGGRMVLPVTEYTLSYKDIYKLEVPFAVPPDVRQHLNTEQNREVSRLLAKSKVMHALRMKNTSEFPFTTAPALLFKGERILAQSLMTYTPVGGSVDIEITEAVNVQAKKQDKETGRQDNAIRVNGNNYSRTDLAGKITITNYKDEPIDLEVTRYIAGFIDSASQGGTCANEDVFDFEARLGSGLFQIGGSSWWSYWPGWWTHVNGLGRAEWKIQLDPSEKVELDYTWHFFWRW